MSSLVSYICVLWFLPCCVLAVCLSACQSVHCHVSRHVPFISLMIILICLVWFNLACSMLLPVATMKPCKRTDHTDDILRLSLDSHIDSYVIDLPLLLLLLPLHVGFNAMRVAVKEGFAYNFKADLVWHNCETNIFYTFEIPNMRQDNALTLVYEWVCINFWWNWNVVKLLLL